MFRQSLREQFHPLPATWQADYTSENRLSSDAAELNQADDRRGNHWEEAQGQPIVLAQDAKALDTADGMLDADTPAREEFVFSYLLLGQLTAFRLFLWGRELRMLTAHVSLVAKAGFASQRLRQRGLLVQLEIRFGATMPCTDRQNLSGLIGRDLRLERVPFLLPRVEPPLALGHTWPAHGCLKAIHNHQVHFIRRPGRFTAPPLLFRLPLLCGKQVPQDRHHFVEGVLRRLGAVTIHHPDDLVTDVVAQ